MIPIHFAPLQGYTEDVYRRLHHQLFGGVAQYYTPFVRLEHGEVRNKDLRDVNPDNNRDVPVIPQIIASGGKEAEELLQIILPMGYRQIDINMGCPFPLQTRHGRGSGLLSHPKQVREICQVIDQHAEISFSIKMRLGLNSKDEWKQILPLLNEVPLSHITLHSRMGSQQYKGQIDKSSFEAFLAESKHPIFYNGDVRTLSDIQHLEQTYPTLAGIMMGRGLLARPSLATEYVTGTPWTNQELKQVLLQMHQHLYEHYAQIIPGETQLMQKLRTFWDYLEPGAEDALPLMERKVWKKIMKAGNMKNYLQAVEEFNSIR